MSGRLKRMVEAYGVKSWGPEGVDYDELVRGLSVLEAEIGCKGCRKGDGNNACNMRKCAQGKNVCDCIECHDRGVCEHKEEFARLRDGAMKADMVGKNEGAEAQELIKRWEREVEQQE